jgi:hypothetical protein
MMPDPAQRVPAKYRGMYQNAIDGKLSPSKAIWVQCLECMGWQKTEVETCDAHACPLYAYRARAVKRLRRARTGR